MDIIEVGFFIVFFDDLEVVCLIVKEVGNNVDEDGYVFVICGFFRCNKKDIDVVWEVVKYVFWFCIYIFIVMSEIYMVYKLKKIFD